MDCRSLQGLLFPSRFSLVEHLRLDRSVFPGCMFDAFIGSSKALKFLSYSTYLTGDFSPRIMRDALLKHHRDTLEELHVACRGRPYGFIGHLCGFTALKNVKLNSQMLGCRLLWIQTERLVQFFPRTIELIEIKGGLEGEVERMFFEFFSLFRKSHVPNLKLVDAHDHLSRWPKSLLYPTATLNSRTGTSATRCQAP